MPGDVLPDVCMNSEDEIPVDGSFSDKLDVLLDTPTESDTSQISYTFVYEIWELSEVLGMREKFSHRFELCRVFCRFCRISSTAKCYRNARYQYGSTEIYLT